MRAYPDDEPGMDLLVRVLRRLPAAESDRLAALPREDFLTWIEVYFTVRRCGVELDESLQADFMAQLFTEVGIDEAIEAEREARRTERRAPTYLAAPTGLFEFVAAN